MVAIGHRGRRHVRSRKAQEFFFATDPTPIPYRPSSKGGLPYKRAREKFGVAVRKSRIQKAETVGRLIKIPNWRRPGLPAFVHLYSAAFLRGGRVRNELLAVAGTSQAFVVGSKSLNQCACRTRREEPAADWRNYQASNQRVSVGDRLCNSR
jgi:hypothetical protein